MQQKETRKKRGGKEVATKYRSIAVPKLDPEQAKAAIAQATSASKPRTAKKKMICCCGDPGCRIGPFNIEVDA